MEVKDRFYVVEGRKATPNRGNGWVPEFMILDRAYCCKVVRRYPTRSTHLDVTRNLADAECRDLNGRLG